jgi:hypothetical protein
MSIGALARGTKAAVVAGIVTFSVLAGAGAGWAYWSSQATATTSASAATLSITSAGFATTTLGNENIASTGSTSLTRTGSITFTNTTTTASTQAQTLNVTFSLATGDSTLATATNLTAWYVASAASCTDGATPSSPSSGSWAAGVTVSRTLVPGASVTYCLRSTVANRQSIAVAGGTRTFTPQAAATLSAGNFSGARTVTSTIQSQYIYQLQAISTGIWWNVKRASTNWCWDISNSVTTSGALLISYGCKNNADTNQDFRYVDADGDGYGNFQPRHSTNLRVAAAASTASGSAVDMRTADANAAAQQWQPQLVAGSGATGTYQLVNKYSGLCLSAPDTSAGVMTQVVCSDGADQRFTLTQRTVVQLANVTCNNLTYSWTSDWNGGGYTVQAQRLGTWVTIAEAPAVNATSATVSSAAASTVASWGDGTYTVQIINSTGSVVGMSSIKVTTTWIIWPIWPDDTYARC